MSDDTEINIILLDSQIQDFIKKEINNIKNYIGELKEIKNIKSSPQLTKLRKRKKFIEKRLNILFDKTPEKNSILINYISDTSKLLDDYKKFINKPIKKSFVNTIINKEFIECKNKYILDFYYIAKKYTNEFTEMTSIIKPYDIYISELLTIKDICKCGGNDIIDNELYLLCNLCGNEISKFTTSELSYKDIDRVNINKKYKYDLKIHFRDTINQFQGKQNKFIAPSVYKALEKEFEIHGLVNKEAKTRHEQYAKITLNNIRMFLLETGNNKYYEDVNLLHYYYTGIKPPDISSLEQVLLDDFDKIQIAYNDLDIKKNIEKVNFMNGQYVLYQLLRRHKFYCKDEYFSMLKTIEKKLEHDDIMEKIFNKLQWKFEPAF